MAIRPISRRSALQGGAGLALSASLSPLAQAAAGNRYVTARNGALDPLDPHQVFDIGRITIRLNMYDALVRWVDNPPRLEMWLAENVTISSDGTVYTFTLRKGVKFHDGAPLSADDVVFSMQRILGMKKGAYGLYKDLVEPSAVKALDAGTVQFTLSKPSAVFLATLCECWVVNSKLVRSHEKAGDWAAAWLARNEAGSGSYQLVRNDPALGFQARQFKEHFWGWHEGAVTDLEFRVVLETASRVLGVMKGEFNTADGYLPYDQIKRMRDSGAVTIVEQPSMRTFWGILNTAKAPLNDINLRKAMSYAFDYDGFNRNILEGSVDRNPGMIPATMWGAPKDLQGYTYDLDKARQHLAMVKGPLRQLQCATLSGFPISEQAGQMLQAGCAKIGLEIKVIAEPSPVIISKLNDPDRAHDIVFQWQSAYYADPHNWTGYLFNSRNIGSGNYTFFKNARVDELTDKALATTDKETRRGYYEEVSRILVDEAPGLFIHNTKYYGAYTKNVKKVQFCPIGDTQDIRWIVMG
jgi:peptide/nickel transport system substrate-binding protein